MAKITNRHLFTFDADAWGSKRSAKVGNNRTLELGTNGCTGEPMLTFRLYGHAIGTVSRLGPRGGVELMLDHCGHMTVTTRQAMNDFLGALGFSGGVSFAGGDFTLRINGVKEWIEREGDDVNGRHRLTFMRSPMDTFAAA